MMIGIVVLFAAQVSAGNKIELKTDLDKVSYSIGLGIGTNMKRQSIDVNMEALTTGIQDALSGGDVLLTDEEVQKVMTDFQAKTRTQAEEAKKVAAETNLKEGEAFLTANKEKEDVVVLTSGLQYKVLQAGSGKMPKATDTVTTHYRGTLIDETEFDSSYSRGEPTSFPVGGVIAGWTEALQLMKVGAKWRLFVPSNLAYGERGAGQMIGPNAALIFEVELLSIQE